MVRLKSKVPGKARFISDASEKHALSYRKEGLCLIAYAALIDDQADLLIFNELVEKYQEEMFRIARSVLFDHQLAEDAVQNALYGIAVSFKSIPSNDIDAAHTYMLSCAKYAALRIKKSRQQVDEQSFVRMEIK